MKDAYFRVQVARRHLAVDKQIRDQLNSVIKKMTDESRRIDNEEDPTPSKFGR